MAATNSTKSRRKEEVKLLQNKILDAALQLATKEGWAGVTIRKIAKIIRYSPPAIYRYFDSKDDIMIALYRRALQTFKSYVYQEAEVPNLREGMVIGAEKYWNFGFENPELYELLFTIHTPHFKEEKDIEEGKNMFMEGLRMIEAINPTLDFAKQHDMLANYLSLMHGFVHLALCNKLYTYEGGAPDAKEAMIRAVRRFVQTI